MIRKWIQRILRPAKKDKGFTPRQRYTIKDMQDYAKFKGGRCLSKEYINANTKLEWQCEHGHTWETPFFVIKQGGWCRQCLKTSNTQERLALMQEIAKQRGGKCLSEIYIHSNIHMEWECGKGHRWKAVPQSIISRKSWCPHCAGRARLTMEHMHDTAKKHGGKCLSKEYVNNTTKLVWQCEKGHIWKATPRTIRNGRWCPHLDCRYAKSGAKLRADINEIRKLAEQRGGKLLSTTYKNRKIPVKWQCAKGHQWMAAVSNIKFGKTWCPVCSGKQKRTLKDMKALAKSKGGKCLSTTYIAMRAKMKWQCSKGHVFETRPALIVHRGVWCNTCREEERRGYELKKMKELAVRKGGKCLSTSYVSLLHKLKWQCKDGHVWETKPVRVVHRGNWCPECSKKLRGRKKTKNLKNEEKPPTPR